MNMVESLLELIQAFKRLNVSAKSVQEISEWLDQAQAFSRTWDANLPPQSHYGVWRDHHNREQLLYKLSSTIANKVAHERTLARHLNQYAHSRVRITREGASYLSSWRLHIDALPLLLQLIFDCSSRSLRRALIIGPELGLSLTALIDSGLFSEGVWFIDPPEPLSIEAHFLRFNLTECQNSALARTGAAPRVYDSFPLAPRNDPAFDVIYFEEIRTSKRRRLPLAAVTQLCRAWDKLAVGGLAVIEGLYLRDNVINREIWQSGPEEGIEAFLQAFSDTYSLERRGDLTILQKTGVA